MLKRFQVYGHKQRVWKFCYPGATAEELHHHLPTEKLPGEACVGAVILGVGTNDLSRTRGRIRTSKEVFEYLTKFLLRLGCMYPQAEIIYMGILPRLDCDNDRVNYMNSRIRMFMYRQPDRFSCLLFNDDFQDTVWPGPTKVPKSEYYRNLSDDTVHLSSSGTQVQQDVLNTFLSLLFSRGPRRNIDRSLLMWQTEWERFNYWNLKTPSVRTNSYLVRKRLTNFTEDQYKEVLANEALQKRNQ